MQTIVAGSSGIQTTDKLIEKKLEILLVKEKSSHRSGVQRKHHKRLRGEGTLGRLGRLGEDPTGTPSQSRGQALQAKNVERALKTPDLKGRGKDPEHKETGFLTCRGHDSG